MESVLKKFKPFKTTGHLSIGKDSKSIKTEEHEFSYSKKLSKGAAYIFFDQESKDRNTLVIIEEGSQLCNIMENAYGMEYFLSNKELDYLIAVNWYAIEGAGLAKNWFSELAKE
ncbi:hypothetical protein BFW38_16960 [Terasakiispira papahanaumokuakeensis]|uniref:Uncharacterized protein n=1 Tax=Terasakiispira papahanaumokuakeensis TaxID=197479 RepID=A0A1E2VEZ5_9GAMM|nr:hypothetical protein BFW38_16960 [Terasakiispira papahanaumokuakeensis]